MRAENGLCLILWSIPCSSCRTWHTTVIYWVFVEWAKGRHQVVKSGGIKVKNRKTECRKSPGAFPFSFQLPRLQFTLFVIFCIQAKGYFRENWCRMSSKCPSHGLPRLHKSPFKAHFLALDLPCWTVNCLTHPAHQWASVLCTGSHSINIWMKEWRKWGGGREERDLE